MGYGHAAAIIFDIFILYLHLFVITMIKNITMLKKGWEKENACPLIPREDLQLLPFTNGF